MAAISQLVQIELSPPVRQPKPEWLRAKAPVGENFHNLKKLARGLGLHTVCESAQCPNIGECWNHRTATFMLLGDICTRRCGFCAVPKGKPGPIEWDEPRRVAEAVATLGLKHTVVTSVNRDDDNLGGARIFAETIRQIRDLVPDCRVEVLIPDFQGLDEALKIVLDAQPDVLNHNTETVPRLYRSVRSGARYANAALAGEREGVRARDGNEIRRDGGLGRDHERTGRSLPRPGFARCGHSYRRAILAAFTRSSAHFPLLHAG
jgi:lipoic acid synthetase